MLTLLVVILLIWAFSNAVYIGPSYVINGGGLGMALLVVLLLLLLL